MSNITYVIAYKAIKGAFDYQRKYASDRDWPPQKISLEYGDYVITSETLTQEFLCRFNLFELRDLLVLAIITFRQEVDTSSYDNTGLKIAIKYLNNEIKCLSLADLPRRNCELAAEVADLKSQLDAIKNVITHQ